ncbi:MAG: lysophospholipid acyltransferase family protein, partial [Candidatus Omnitrophota bacterium]
MIYYLIYKLGEFIAINLPLKLAYKVAILISDLRYLIAAEDRKNVAANLKVIFPNKSLAEIKSIRLSMFRNFAKYLMDFFRFSLLNKENIKNSQFGLVNQHFIDEALAKGKGVIILSAHIGNWEIGGVGLALLGYSIGAVALPHRHKSVDNFFNSQRQNKGLVVMPLGKAARSCLQLLRENKIIALAGDRLFNSNGRLTDFFGMPTYLPEGPAAFSLKTGAVIVPGFVVRDKNNISNLIFEKPIEYRSSGDKERDLMQILNKYKTIIEDYIRRYPEQ